jgi:high affinity Mn2+ porin
MRPAKQTSGCWSISLLALLFAGCTTLPVAGFGQDESPATTGSEKPAKPPVPRTLPQAVHAYVRRLCSPQGSVELAKDTAGAGERQKSDDQPNGESQQQEEAQKKENGKEEKNKEPKDKEPEPAWYSAHAQATLVTQKHGGFNAPYTGPNSLRENEPAATSVTGTVFLDVRLWECGSSSTDLVFNPEVAGGRGFSNTSGIAGFPNLEITRVGVAEPVPYIARLYVRQTCGLGGEQERVEDGPNQIAGMRDTDRITLTIGKFAATDLVDDNRYSHDGRTQFLPWSFAYNGAWDYPANVRGYDYGIGIELNRKNWALRYGIFAEPEFANSAPLDPHFTKAFGQVVELEERYTAFGHSGRLRLLAYLNRARMGDYAEALAAMPVNPDVTQTRNYRYKYGFGMSWNQELTKDLGVWARLGWDDGHTESFAFTAIDRLFDIGLLLKGRCWCRPNDQIGLAYGINGLEGTHRNYLAAGGLDFIIGDGALNYAPEQILEAFYNLEVRKGIYVTTDFQEVINPAYNADRGPVSVVSLRVHLEY